MFSFAFCKQNALATRLEHTLTFCLQNVRKRFCYAKCTHQFRVFVNGVFVFNAFCLQNVNSKKTTFYAQKSIKCFLAYVFFGTFYEQKCIFARKMYAKNNCKAKCSARKIQRQLLFYVQNL